LHVSLAPQRLGISKMNAIAKVPSLMLGGALQMLPLGCLGIMRTLSNTATNAASLQMSFVVQSASETFREPSRVARPLRAVPQPWHALCQPVRCFANSGRASIVSFPLAQTGEGISECELMRWAVKVSRKPGCRHICSISRRCLGIFVAYPWLPPQWAGATE